MAGGAIRLGLQDRDVAGHRCRGFGVLVGVELFPNLKGLGFRAGLWRRVRLPKSLEGFRIGFLNSNLPPLPLQGGWGVILFWFWFWIKKGALILLAIFDRA